MLVRVAFLLTGAVGVTLGYPGLILSYNTGTHLRQEMGEPGKAVTGEYRWLTEDGKENFVSYTADENGYIARGNIVPGYYQPLTNPKLLQSATTNNPPVSPPNEKSADSNPEAKDEVSSELSNNALDHEIPINPSKDEIDDMIPAEANANAVETSPQEGPAVPKDATNDDDVNEDGNDIANEGFNPIVFPSSVPTVKSVVTNNDSDTTPVIKDATEENESETGLNEIVFPSTMKSVVEDDGNSKPDEPKKNVPGGYVYEVPTDPLFVNLFGTPKDAELKDSAENSTTFTENDITSDSPTELPETLREVIPSTDANTVTTEMITEEMLTEKATEPVTTGISKLLAEDEVTTADTSNTPENSLKTNTDIQTTQNPIVVSKAGSEETASTNIPDSLTDDKIDEVTTSSPSDTEDQQDEETAVTEPSVFKSAVEDPVTEHSPDLINDEDNPEANIETVEKDIPTTTESLLESDISATEKPVDVEDSSPMNDDTVIADNIRNSINEPIDETNRTVPVDPVLDSEMDTKEEMVPVTEPDEDIKEEVNSPAKAPEEGEEEQENVPNIIRIINEQNKPDPAGQNVPAKKPEEDNEENDSNRRPYYPWFSRPCSTPHFHYPSHYQHPPHFHSPPYRHNPPGHHRQSFRPFLKFFPGMPRTEQKKPTKGIFFNIFH